MLLDTEVRLDVVVGRLPVVAGRLAGSGGD
jgi:hypothetical protein